MTGKDTFLFLWMTKAQMKMLMPRMTTPMVTTSTERLSTVRPSLRGLRTWGPGVNVMFPLLNIKIDKNHQHDYMGLGLVAI